MKALPALFPVSAFAGLLGCADATTGPVSPVEFASAAGGCWERIAQAQSDPVRIDSLLERETAAMQRRLEEGLALQARTLRLAQTLEAGRSDDAPLSGAELDALQRNRREGVDLARTLHTAAVAQSCWADAEPAALRSRGIAPPDRAQRVAGAMLELAATLLLYDCYVLAVAFLAEDPRIRGVLNESDPSHDIEHGQLAALNDTYLSITGRMRVRELIALREAAQPSLEWLGARDPAARYLDQFIETSPSYALLRDPSVSATLSARFERLRDRQGDDLRLLARSAEGGISRTFGNTVGLVQTRRGKLSERPEVEAAVAVELRAGDILLEKTPFRLTDKLIPGHWGHAAIWLGNESELRELGIETHPLVRRYREPLRDGRLVVEALRDGVQLNTLRHFLDVDDLAVLRPNALSREQLAATIVRALEQVGKDYDFNFDVESQERIVCSELVYVAYTDFTWPTDRQLGRYTISPDNVALLSLDDGPFDLVLLYHDGPRS